MNCQTIRLVNTDAPKPGNLSPEPGAILRGQLSPTKMTNAAVKSIGIAKGSNNLTKKVGGTISREAWVFVTSQSYRTLGLRNHLRFDRASGVGGISDPSTETRLATDALEIDIAASQPNAGKPIPFRS